jgi:PAS domain S-box-containing protein
MSTGNISSLDSASSAPLVRWHEEDERAHVVQLYSSDEFLVEGVSRFIGAALGSGGSGLMVATPAHEAAIRATLQGKGFDLLSPAMLSRCIFLDAAETLAQFMTGDSPDRERFTALMGGAIDAARQGSGSDGRVAIFGEMVTVLWAEGKAEAAIQLEQLWNGLAQTHAFSLRCAYPIQGFDQDHHALPFLKICDAHSAVIPGESYSALDSDQERLRNIGFLQQRAQALEKEKLERKHVENSLRLREAELTDLLENAPEGVQRVGADQKISWANGALLDLLGYSTEEYAGHSLAEFYVKRENFDEFWRRLMAREDIHNFPGELRCKDGSSRHVLIHSNGLWDGDRFVYTRCFIRDVSDRRKAEMALRESEARLRKAKDELENIVQQRTVALRRLSSQVLGLQDAERRRIARELHDSLGQYLAVLKLNIEMLRGNPASEELWAESEKLTERCISEMRTLSYLLHPPMIDEAGLASAARWYIDGFGERSGTKVSLDASDELGRLPGHMELALFRVLQEGLTNVHRHAKASAIAVRIARADGRVILEIRDNGRGIPAEVLQRFTESGAGTGVGLTGMRERVSELGGQLTLDSNGAGTALKVSVPVPRRWRSAPPNSPPTLATR